MSRGFGAVQRRVLDALARRADHDIYRVTDDDVIELISEYDDLADEYDWPKVVRARWRWYTIDLLGIAEFAGSRSERVSLHRAIKALGRAGHVETTGNLPYQQPYAAYTDYLGKLTGGIDLNELNTIDHRWPPNSGRTLWFRLPAPPQDNTATTADDQLAILDFIAHWRPDAFEDFVATLDHKRRWNTPIGRFIAWLFCGQPQSGIH